MTCLTSQAVLSLGKKLFLWFITRNPAILFSSYLEIWNYIALWQCNVWFTMETAVQEDLRKLNWLELQVTYYSVHYIPPKGTVFSCLNIHKQWHNYNTIRCVLDTEWSEAQLEEELGRDQDLLKPALSPLQAWRSSQDRNGMRESVMGKRRHSAFSQFISFSVLSRSRNNKRSGWGGIL